MCQPISESGSIYLFSNTHSLQSFTTVAPSDKDYVLDKACSLEEEIKQFEYGPIQGFILKWEWHLFILKISKPMLINKKQQQNNHKNKEKQTCIYKKIASTELLPIYENICNICSLNLVKTHW